MPRPELGFLKFSSIFLMQPGDVTRRPSGAGRPARALWRMESNAFPCASSAAALVLFRVLSFEALISAHFEQISSFSHLSNGAPESSASHLMILNFFPPIVMCVAPAMVAPVLGGLP